MRALGTAGLTAVDGHPGSYMFLAIAEPFTRRGVVCGWLTSEKASGIVQSGVRDGRIVITPFLEGGKDPADRETFVFGTFDDCRLGLEAYADAIARRYGIRLSRQISGYCTWYADIHGRAGDEASTRTFADAAVRLLKPWGFDFFQIDDGCQLGRPLNGPCKNFTAHDPKGPYPGGMGAIAAELSEKGICPGLWFMPFAGTKDDPFFADKRMWFVRNASGEPVETFWGGTCFDVTDRDFRGYLRQVVSRISREWGYRYFKCDGIWTATGCAMSEREDAYWPKDGIGRQVFDDPRETAIGAYRAGVRAVREAAGDGVFLLACNVAQNMRTLGASYGLVDACRIGPDNGPRWQGEYNMRTGPIRGTARYFYNGRVWYNDPDPVYVRQSLPVGQARALASWVAVSGSLYAFSDWLPDLPADRVEILRRTMAPHRLYAATRPIDLFESPLANAWSVTQGVHKVIALFNWSDKTPLKVDYEAAYAGLDPKKEYVGFDFWEKRFLPSFRGRLQTEVGKASCRVIALRETSDSMPVLVSTSRHVTSPAFDVRSTAWEPRTSVMSGVSEVVGGEPYELYFWLPRGWTCPDGRIEGRTARVTLRPSASGEFAWKVRFVEVGDLPERVAEELQHEIRPGGVEGRPFWNVRARAFMYPPSFPFTNCPSATAWRFRVIDDGHTQHVFRAESPFASLRPVWRAVPTGLCTVFCEGLDASGRSVGLAGERRFWKLAPFRPGTYPPAVCSYGECARRIYDYLFDSSNVRYFRKTGKPDPDYPNNSYPSKMHASLVRAMVLYAQRRPDRAAEALKTARTAAEYLLGGSEPAGAPLAGFPQTYEVDPSLRKQAAESYSGEIMMLYPADVGEAYLALHAATGEAKWLAAAKTIGEGYLRLQGEDGTWPLKLRTRDGLPAAPNRLFPLETLPFFEKMHAAIKDVRYRAAADRAADYAARGPLKTFNWEGQFEDVGATPPYLNLTKYPPCEYARHMLSRHPGDCAVADSLRELVRFAEDQFVYWEKPCRADGVCEPFYSGIWVGDPSHRLQLDFTTWYNLPGVGEQYFWNVPIDCSAGELIRTWVAFWESSGNPLDLAKAKAMGDAITRSQFPDGHVPTHWTEFHRDTSRGGNWLNCMVYTAESLEILQKAVDRRRLNGHW